MATKQQSWLSTERTTNTLLIIMLVMSVLILGKLLTLSLQVQELTEAGITGNSIKLQKESAVIIEKFSDYECPYCLRAHETLEQVKELYGDSVTVVYKHFPLPTHPNAFKAAEAAECARDQEAFDAFHNQLFLRQRNLNTDTFMAIAKQLELDMDTFSTCYTSGKKTSLVEKHIQEGRSKGVSGTPTFYINGEILHGAQPLESFKNAIDRQLGKPVQRVANEQVGAVEPTWKNNPVVGKADAPVTIFEFSDFECPFCGRFYSQTFPQLKKEYIDTGKVRFVYKDYPLSFHPNAHLAAVAGRCAHEEKKFWEYHDKIFENQRSLNRENFITWATEVGLDVKKFTTCLDSSKYDALIEQDMQEGTSNGITGTPGFLVNGVPIKGAVPFEQFKTVIDAQLGAGG